MADPDMVPKFVLMTAVSDRRPPPIPLGHQSCGVGQSQHAGLRNFGSTQIGEILGTLAVSAKSTPKHCEKRLPESVCRNPNHQLLTRSI